MRLPQRSRYCSPLRSEHLPGAAREDQNRFPLAHERVHDFRCTVDDAEAREEVAPDRNPEMQMIAEGTYEYPAALVEPEHHERGVENAHERVVACEEEGPIGGHVLEPLEARRRHPTPRREDESGRFDLGPSRPVPDGHCTALSDAAIRCGVNAFTREPTAAAGVQACSGSLGGEARHERTR